MKKLLLAILMWGLFSMTAMAMDDQCVLLGDQASTSRTGAASAEAMAEYYFDNDPVHTYTRSEVDKINKSRVLNDEFSDPEIGFFNARDPINPNTGRPIRSLHNITGEIDNSLLRDQIILDHLNTYQATIKESPAMQLLSNVSEIRDATKAIINEALSDYSPLEIVNSKTLKWNREIYNLKKPLNNRKVIALLKGDDGQLVADLKIGEGRNKEIIRPASSNKTSRKWVSARPEFPLSY